MNIYIAGSKGMVGSAVKSLLTTRDKTRIVFDDGIDLRDQNAVRSFFKQHNIDAVVVAAAFLIIVVSPIIFGLHGILRRRYSNSNARSISWVFLLVSSLFMINEIKQGFITENYFLIIMFWIGIAVSIQRYGFRDDEIIDARR